MKGTKIILALKRVPQEEKANREREVHQAELDLQVNLASKASQEHLVILYVPL